MEHHSQVVELHSQGVEDRSQACQVVVDIQTHILAVAHRIQVDIQVEALHIQEEVRHRQHSALHVDLLVVRHTREVDSPVVGLQEVEPQEAGLQDMPLEEELLVVRNTHHNAICMGHGWQVEALAGMDPLEEELHSLAADTLEEHHMDPVAKPHTENSLVEDHIAQERGRIPVEDT